MKIYSRKVWGAQRSDGDGTRLSGPARLVLHHTVTHVPGGAKATVAQEKAHMRLLERIVNGRWGSGLGYNWVLFPSGRVYAGTTPTIRGTHTGGNNSTLLAIAVVGNFQSGKPPASLISNLAELAAQLGKTVPRLRGNGKFAGGHRDFSATACPGQNLYPKISEINSRISNSKPSKPSTPGEIAEDGLWGRDTTSLLQEVLGTPVDGEVWNQNRKWKSRNPGLTRGWKWKLWSRGLKGSPVIAAMQRVLKVNPDGLIGPATINALSARYGVRGDGHIDRPSITVERMQRALNAGKF